MTGEDLRRIENEFRSDLGRTRSAAEAEALRFKYLGRKAGKLNAVLRSLKDVPDRERGAFGAQANKLRSTLESELAKRINEFGASPSSAGKEFDVTLPGTHYPHGHVHPMTQVREEVLTVFRSMGFDVYEGDELVTDFYNFEALNIPALHPARDAQDTFFVDQKKGLLMRTHTSSMQVKIMEKQKPPLRVVIPGRCFRNEATDASHDHTFYQLEGFLVDTDVSIANLLATQKTLLEAIFHREVKVRLRPGYFPFVEPGFELDCSCVICGGTGCKVCKRSGWVELIPCGMINQNVFAAAGYPKGKYTGFAFGLGLSRLAMMKYVIDDIRLFHGGDVRFTRQF